MKKTNTIFNIYARSLLTVLLVIFLIIPVQATSFSFDTTRVNVPRIKPWTTLFYLDVDYDSGNYDALEQEFRDEIASNENINVVVIQDKEHEPAFMYYIEENHSKTLLAEMGEINMGDHQTLSDFIAYGKEYYPAERYLLYIYDHGGGWKGACMDTTNNDILTMDEFQKALQETGGVDIIAFFACLMASIESIYELRDLVDVYIGSEDLGYGYWWDGVCGDMNQLLTTNPSLSTDEAGSELVEFFQDHPNIASDLLTMSAIKVEKIEPLVQEIHTLHKYYVTHWLQYYKPIKQAHEATYMLADYLQWAEIFEEYDLRGYLENLPQCSSTEKALQLFDEAVLTHVHGSERPDTYGLNIFFPSQISPHKLCREYREAGLALDLPTDTCWNEFLFFFILTNTIFGRFTT